MINRLAVITTVSDGTGYISNDRKYIQPAFRKVVKICHEIKNDVYITDYFYPEYIDKKNDYIHYGFLIVHRNNITLLENTY